MSGGGHGGDDPDRIDDEPSTPEPSVLCVGHVNWDVTLIVDRLPAPDGEVKIRRRHQAGGGSAANVAAVLAGLDLDASLFGSVGADESGELAERELSGAGVRTHLVEADGETAVKYLIVDADGEVMVLSNEGANEAFTAEDLPPGALTEETDHLHLTNQPPAVAAALAARAREGGATVSVAPGRQFAERDFTEVLSRADLVFCNRREAAALLDEDDDGATAYGVLREDATLVVTHGGDGSEAHDRGGDRTIVHDGFDADVVDTTGAGDAFAAGFLAARLDGAELERALAVANACGAIAAGEVGARVEITWERIESALAAAADGGTL
ncbi:carbohydrate kinase family protein [Halobaculum sp. WSA2]|uniref:Carbohydrate kinase family protein n=1 Tax=Halobaculum saliterrae TaxID=2073113 RepID=A0A6B0T239_9EURY|nr:PfkB family carbohydrate kinase [Halobaculum saliterrae]MXR42672.1 carbohydrate kinase family protein [Halobaculum saliterrae]